MGTGVFLDHYLPLKIINSGEAPLHGILYFGRNAQDSGKIKNNSAGYLFRFAADQSNERIRINASEQVYDGSGSYVPAARGAEELSCVVRRLLKCLYG